MPSRVVRVRSAGDGVAAESLRQGIAQIQAELKVTADFPASVEEAAAKAATSPRLPDLDRTDIPFVTIDPADAMDLDQALHIERDGDGFVVHYAIADLAAFITAGDSVDVEANRRGETLYGADSKIPLHPKAISEGAGSLLPDQVRPALLWTIAVDATGEGTSVKVERAAQTLGIGHTQLDLVHLNGRLFEAHTARADRVYTGVLYDNLDFATLSSTARRRASSRVAVVSSVFGLVRPGDHIPAYRLSGDVVLPSLGPVAGVWRDALGPAVEEALGGGLLVDLRSTMYAAFWRPPSALAPRVATVRVLHEHNGARKVVSHFNKATKGRIVRDLLEDGGNPRTPGELADLLADLGWKVEVGEPGRKGTQLDVVVDEV
jgi:hypothetical protein